jgi:hypothetical protein
MSTVQTQTFVSRELKIHDAAGSTTQSEFQLKNER